MNLVCGFSVNPDQWAIRSEFGLMKNLASFNDYSVVSFCVEFTLYINTLHRTSKPKS